MWVYLACWVDSLFLTVYTSSGPLGLGINTSLLISMYYRLSPSAAGGFWAQGGSESGMDALQCQEWGMPNLLELAALWERTFSLKRANTWRVKYVATPLQEPGGRDVNIASLTLFRPS